MKWRINISIGKSFGQTFYDPALEEQNQNNRAYA